MDIAWVWTTLAVLVSVSLIHGLVKKMNGKKWPPGPRGLPILGHLHLLGQNPHHDLNKLAKQYGPIMHLRFGLANMIVASSPQAAELFLKTHDLVFASRPPQEAAKYISYGQMNLSSCPYGPYWRNMRKLCTLELLSNLKINSFQAMRREELCYLIESLKQAALDRVAVDLSSKVSELIADISCRMVFGKKYEMKDLDERGFRGVLKEEMDLFGKVNLGDYFPFLSTLDLQGLTRRMKALAKTYDKFFERILDDHEQSGQSGSSDQTKDFVDTMLSIMKSGEAEFQFNREHIKPTLSDLFGASEAITILIEWIMSELLRHPEIMKKVQEELKSKIGLDRMVEESDLEDLKYLEMVVKESLRLHPVAPLIPNEAREDCMIEGFHIPKKSRIIINVWAITHDPNVWTNPEKFIPERFEGSNIDYRGRHFELIPFGSGRRICPGLQLGITLVRLVVAQLLHCFDWEFPNSMPYEELDMTEQFGLLVSRANHLIVIPNYRLHI
ncbi:PREDICTED: cytochrome P450 CYP736A12-like [Ipomoea nil]|uniref:cytochrome P450 CYP736A12-like n=1 Tax=Ipomoea nil TaxID=35883 RepID=UPI000901CE79|nr:PREDICTED: cytochrome P450 CYP736A12-like [Ipomoea nil]